jgi:hypothetical protein
VQIATISVGETTNGSDKRFLPQLSTNAFPVGKMIANRAPVLTNLGINVAPPDTSPPELGTRETGTQKLLRRGEVPSSVPKRRFFDSTAQPSPLTRKRRAGINARLGTSHPNKTLFFIQARRVQYA